MTTGIDPALIRAFAAGFAAVFNPSGHINLNTNGAFPTNFKNSDIGTSNQPAAVTSWVSQPNSWVLSPSSGGWDYVSKPAPTVVPTATYTPPVYAVAPVYYPPPPKPAPPIPPGPPPQFTKEVEKELVKYEYVYGVKDLQIKGNEYNLKSIYVSQPIQVSGNVMQVGLSAVEEHPLFNDLTGEATYRQTSVEYYISYIDNPGLDDWHAILPEEEDYIQSELLIFDTGRTSKNLRFPALVFSDPLPKMYKNGVEFEDWSFTSGATKIQLLTERSVNAIYTIDYTPNAEIIDPYTIDIYQLSPTVMKQVDVFTEGTNHNKTLTLSQYPYIDYSIINTETTFDPNLDAYRPIKVTLQNANIAGANKSVLKQVDPYTGSAQAAWTYNITDYKTKEWKDPKAYSLDKITPYYGFEYWQNADKVYFSETFNQSDILTNQEINHGNAEIAIEYYYLLANFRVKIILRRNGAAINSVSPMVHAYALKFKVMK